MNLLDALLRLDGDALVMHVGEKPYVIASSAGSGEFRGSLDRRQVELSSRVLTVDAVHAMANQLLPAPARAALDECGAAEHEVVASGDRAHCTLIAARGGEDVWLEIRRRQAAPAPSEVLPAPARDVPVWIGTALSAPGRTGYAAEADRGIVPEFHEPDEVLTEGDLGEMLRAVSRPTGERTRDMLRIRDVQALPRRRGGGRVAAPELLLAALRRGGIDTRVLERYA